MQCITTFDIHFEKNYLPKTSWLYIFILLRLKTSCTAIFEFQQLSDVSRRKLLAFIPRPKSLFTCSAGHHPRSLFSISFEKFYIKNKILS